MDIGVKQIKKSIQMTGIFNQILKHSKALKQTRLRIPTHSNNHRPTSGTEIGTVKEKANPESQQQR
jgi:hypothetical protein